MNTDANDVVLKTFFKNSQTRFEQVVPSLLSGMESYDVQAYAHWGVTYSQYSHIHHLGWIYAEQIRLVEQLLHDYPDEILTIVDLGTGGGHFLLTLAKELGAKNLLPFVRFIGIDRTEEDMRFARDMVPEEQKPSVTFLLDDLTDPFFADRLRQLKPHVIIANHVLEHLSVQKDQGEDIQNLYLQNWMLAASLMVSVSVPLSDAVDSSLSDHVTEFTPESVEKLARSMEVRVGDAVKALHIEETKFGGLCTWAREPEVVVTGGFNQELITLRPKAAQYPPTPLLTDFHAPFNLQEFAKVRRAEKVGEIQDKATFARQGQSPRQVRQLLIKAPGTDLKLPGELAQFTEAIQIIIDHNRAMNPRYEQCYAYFNAFRGITKMSAYRGLSLNCHGDQLQSLNPDYAFLPDWSYIVSNTLPTMFYAQGFDLTQAHIRLAAGERVNLYDEFNTQAAEENLYWSQNFGIYLLSPYVVHSAAPADHDIERVFMKVAFSTKRFFDNREFRRNPAFDIAEWYRHDTVGYHDGHLSHAHWNERFLKEDICADR